ncbi:hypothetical protein PGT21_008265 [Puccinia graminis f. sp. tritici]|uniref:Uncharacterized protein n=1 Tax=Puccinia graminis f. sp. tritici TaxID=56615 RepID=A0A5B0NDP8_PUCGR|nr:hypothetical protein PGT21_008265 [Puccinia graminis f. sp. tritici]
MLSNRSCRRCRKPLVVFQAAIELSPRGDGAGETRDPLRRDPPIFLWGAFAAVGGCGPGLNTRPAIDPPPLTKLIEPLSAAFLFVWEMPVSSCLLTEVTMPLMLNWNPRSKHILEKPVQLALKGYSGVTFHRRGGNRINNLRNL